MTNQPAPVVGRGERLFESAIILGLLLVTLGLTVWAVWSAGVSVFNWLKLGTWSHPSVADALAGLGWAPPVFDWAIPQRVWTWLLNLPSSLIAAALAFWLFTMVSATEAEITQREQKN